MEGTGMTMKKISPLELVENPFRLIGKDWTLITAEKKGKVNTMTASGGGVGVLWKKNVVFVFVRHSRHTFGFMEAADTFSLTFFPEDKRKMLSYCGAVSGRDEDKVAASGLTVLHEEGTPYFKEARLAVLCRKLYAQDIAADAFADRAILPECYGDNDFHRMYVGEILSVLTQ